VVKYTAVWLSWGEGDSVCQMLVQKRVLFFGFFWFFLVSKKKKIDEDDSLPVFWALTTVNRVDQVYNIIMYVLKPG
jgi:hypothetical protein